MATRSARPLGTGAAPRSPIAVSGPLLALAAVALALSAAPDLPWQGGIVAGAMFGLAALVRIVRQSQELRRLRRAADRIILRSPARLPSSALVAWRARELTGTRHRHALAAETRRLSRELDATSLPGAVPLNRAVVRPFQPELEALALLLDGDQPVGPRGVLLVENLLSDPSGPLYDRGAASRLEPTLRRALTVLGDTP
jgi:hypothetical protein